MRSQVIQHFSSENTRIRTILIANLMNTFARNLVIGHQEKSILNNLASAVARSSSQFNFAPPHFTPIGREHAMSILDSMLEVRVPVNKWSDLAQLTVGDVRYSPFRRVLSPHTPAFSLWIIWLPFFDTRAQSRLVNRSIFRRFY
jgi:hypothetical protein